MQRYLLCCGYAGSSLEVKIETDNNDAVEIKTEADGNDITEYPCDDGPSIDMFGLFHIYLPWIHSLIRQLSSIFFITTHTYNLSACLADHCHITTSEVTICLMIPFYCSHNLAPCLVCFCLWSLCVSIQQHLYLYFTVFRTIVIAEFFIKRALKCTVLCENFKTNWGDTKGPLVRSRKRTNKEREQKWRFLIWL